MADNIDEPEILNALDVPQSSVGAPCPQLFAEEHHLTIGYYVEWTDPSFGDHPRSVSAVDADEAVAIICSDSCLAVQFGPPNDEAIGGHRLYAIGLKPYSAFEVQNSQWILALETMNRVDPDCRSEFFSGYRHFIFTFHDSILEFVAKDFSVRFGRGSVSSVLRDVIDQDVEGRRDRLAATIEELRKRK